MQLDCNTGYININDLINAVNSKEDSLGLGTAGQILATNATADGKEWIDLPSPLSSVPIGFIGMYSGLMADIPSNWAICDGTNGTPDMTGSFIMSTEGVDGTGLNVPHVNLIYIQRIS